MISAVITADIVNSTESTPAVLKKFIKQLEGLMASHLHEFYRGDSFQVLVKSPAEALRLLLLLRAAAVKWPASDINKPLDLRASIGIGVVKWPMRSLHTATDEAFILSGRPFDQMKTDQRLLICSREENITLNLGFSVMTRFIDYLFKHMSAKQAGVVFELLMNRTQIEAARRLKKSQATIHKHAQTAGWPEIEKLLIDYNLMVKTIQ